MEDERPAGLLTYTCTSLGETLSNRVVASTPDLFHTDLCNSLKELILVHNANNLHMAYVIINCPSMANWHA